MTQNVAIFIFPEVEVLDFAGPYEVFAVTGARQPTGHFQTFLVAETMDVVLAKNGFKVVPDYTFQTCPAIHVLVIPGGGGTRPLLRRTVVIDWLRSRSIEADIVISVCTGALLLAKAGLLDGLTITTHHGALGELAALAPNSKIDPSGRFHDNGKFIISGGISAGIDGALHVVGRICGEEGADETARHMEYRRLVGPPS